MEIRKLFKFEMAHIVRKAWSQRCARNVHGHSYLVEVFFDTNTGYLDDAGMVVDFGLIKEAINPFLDSFDHTFMLWDIPEDAHLKEFFTKEFERVIVSTHPTSAESQAFMFYYVINRLLQLKQRGGLIDSSVFLSRVRVHETATGYAEFDYVNWAEDHEEYMYRKDKPVLYFSQEIMDEWSSWLQMYAGSDAVLRDALKVIE